MPKITKDDSRSNTRVVEARTGVKGQEKKPYAWWKAAKPEQRAEELVATAAFLKEAQQYRYRQATVYARLYGNAPLFGQFAGSVGSMSGSNGLPIDRPTMNVVQSCVDTLVSRITQARPRPVFLTDGGNYKERNLAKSLNQFSQGEFYRMKAHEMGMQMFRNAAVLGTGVLKVCEGQNKLVHLERRLPIDLLVDVNDALYGKPRTMYELMLIDRDQLAEMFPEEGKLIARAEQAYPEYSGDATKTVSDQVMLVEAWRLPSGPDANDGRHMIACSAGPLLDEQWNKDRFPFTFLHYNSRMTGLWGQGLAEQLLGTQMEINKLLITISKSINLVGVPRVFVENGSKVVKAHLNNEVGSIVTYSGTKPEYAVAQCMPQEVYAQLQRLIEYAYQQSGISQLAANSQKPAGLDSGQALREYDDIQSDRFAALNRRYDNMFVDLNYLIIDQAKDIAEREGKYSSVYPGKNGTREVDLPKAAMLKDTYIIQCFDASSLPRDPAGRLQKVAEMIQSGMVTIEEGRGLLDFPDLEQSQQLSNSGRERIYKYLDEIVEEGKYTSPDIYMDADMALLISKQYYNLYVAAKLEEDRAEMLRTFNTQAQVLKALAAAAMAPPGAPQGAPQAVPEPLPTSPLLPQAPQQ